MIFSPSHGLSARSAIARIQAIVIIVILVVAAIVGVTYAVSQPRTVTINVASSTNLGSAGSPIQFTVIPSASGASVKSVSWNFGDGNTGTSSGTEVSHAYSNPGSYIVEANATISYTSGLLGYTSTVSDDQALISVQVQSNLSTSAAADGSVPSIGFPPSTNPGAPVFSTGATVSPVGGFLEVPSNSNYTIQSYTWNFGNGYAKSVPASSSTSEPTTNVTGSYSSPGLYPITLTITTNDSAGATQQISSVATVAVQSSARPLALLSTSSGVVNPGVITEAEVQAGGPGSLDPLIDYDSLGGEVATGVFQTLVMYNGSSSQTFLPTVAEALPTVQNGGISSNEETYNFTIRPNLEFSNGDPLNAYAVWYTFMRAYNLASGPTPDWILAEFLVPGVQNGTATYYGNNTYATAVQAITYSNTTNTVAFHFNRAMTNTTVFQVLSGYLGNSIMDPKVIEAAGAGWTEANWVSYANQSEPGQINTLLQFNPNYVIGSGPLMIKGLTPGQSIELVPNPKYTPVPGIPAMTDDIVIDWVSNPNTALLMLENGQADSASNLPNSDYPVMQALQSKGEIDIYNYPSLDSTAYILSIDVNKTQEANQWGQGYNEPSNYFADLPTRYAWLDSYNYTNFVNNLMGNAEYNTTFGVPYVGWMMKGETWYVPPSAVGGLQEENLQWAMGNFSQSAWKDMKITIDIGVADYGPGGGAGGAQQASAELWANTLSQISGGNITAKVVLEPITMGSTQFTTVPLSEYGTGIDYPSGQDYVDFWYPQTGGFSPFEGWTVQNFQTLPPNNTANLVQIYGKSYTQATIFQWINGNVSQGDVAANPTQKQQDYTNAEFMDIKMGLYLYQDQVSAFDYWRTWLHGIQNEQGPMIAGSGSNYLFWLSKS